MNTRKIISVLLIVPLLFASCVKEDRGDCPVVPPPGPPSPPTPPVAEGRIMIAIEDTDYENADVVSKALGIGKAEDPLPLDKYLSSMLVIHHDRETGSYTSRDVAVSDTDPYHYLVNDYFTAEGSNAIMVVGNDQNAAIDYPTLGTTGRMSDITVDLYTDNGVQCREIYIGRGVVSIPVLQDTTIWMQRATGKLVVQVEDIPFDMAAAYRHIENVVTDVDWNLQYSSDGG